MGPVLNRYYTTLKPFYRLDQNVFEDVPEVTDESVPRLLADKTLVFESRFESGNLRKAVKVSPFAYELYMKNDYSTQSYCQWFFFRVQNTRKGQTYTFHITNYMKPESTYNKGMRPLSYSIKEADEQQIGWKRDGQNIAYYCTSKSKKLYKNQNTNPFKNVVSFNHQNV